MLSKKYCNFEISINGFIEIYENNYELGYLTKREFLNEIEEKRFSLENLNNKNLIIIKDRIDEILSKETEFSIRKNKITIDYNCIELNQLLNNEKEEPSKSEIKAWENGEINLLEKCIYIYVHINGEEVETKDLDIIMSL